MQVMQSSTAAALKALSPGCHHHAAQETRISPWSNASRKCHVSSRTSCQAGSIAGSRVQGAGEMGGRGRRRVGMRNGSSRQRGLVVAAASGEEFAILQGKEAEVLSAETGQPVLLSSLWDAAGGERCLLAFLTHFGDLSSWEYAQQLQQKVIPAANQNNVRVVAVGLGGFNNAQAFARNVNFPPSLLFADPTGTLYCSLGFSQGFAADADVSPYAKLVPMLMGIGSPGTIQEVLRGYVGDQTRKPIFDQSTPFDILGKGYQRPFELATLRLNNMIQILPKWNELVPEKTSLITAQGGTFFFKGSELEYKHVDSGILKYANVDELLTLIESKPVQVTA